MSSNASPGRVARNVLIALGLVGLGLLLWEGRDIFFVLFFGVLVGVFLSAMTGLVQRVIPNRIVSLLLVLLVLAGLSAAFWILLWPTVSDQLSTVSRQVPETADEIASWAREQYRGVLGQEAPVEEMEEEVRTRATRQLGSVVSGALPVINTVMGALAGLLLVVAVGIYTAASPGIYRRGFLHLIPVRHRERVAEALDRSEHSLRRWMVGSAVNMLGVGILTYIGLTIIGVPAAIALALIAGLFEFVPIVGPILSSIPAILLGLTVSPTTALWVVVLFILVQQIESNVLTPLVMRGAVHLPPALTVLFQGLMATVFGFLGLLLAVPILAVVLVAVKVLYVEPTEHGSAAPAGHTGA